MLHQTLISEQSNERAGTKSVKSRTTLSMSGAKLAPQKGTGQARVGSASSSIRRGGAASHTLKTSFKKKINQNMKAQAYAQALASKPQMQLQVLNQFYASLKMVLASMPNLATHKKTLISFVGKNDSFGKALSNLPNFTVKPKYAVVLEDILKADMVVNIVFV